MNELMKALNFRHACKAFNEAKTIQAEALNDILEAGRLAPSWMGMQPWHFLVVQKQELKAALSAACNNQKHIVSCSHFVVLLARKPEHFERGSAFLNEMLGGGKVPPERAEFVYSMLGKVSDKLNWAKMQTYLAAAQMMIVAASLGIDSCPIAANPAAEAEAIAKLAPSFPIADFEPALNVALGYRANDQPPKMRLPTEKIVTFV